MKKLPVYIWKEQQPTSWHHTGRYFNKTDHYDLAAYAFEFLDDKKTVRNQIQKHRQKLRKKKKEQQTYTHNIWGGTRKHPKIVGEEIGYGIIKDSRLYPVIFSNPLDDYSSDRQYYSIYSNNLGYDNYKNYDDMIKHEPLYKSTKHLLNKVLKKHRLK